MIKEFIPMASEALPIPRSLDSPDWSQAKQIIESERTAPSKNVSKRRVSVFIRQCAQKYVSELDTQISRLNRLFELHLPGLLNSEVSHEGLPDLRIKLSKTLSRDRTPPEEERVGVEIEEGIEKLAFAQKLVRQLPQGFFHPGNRALAKKVGDLAFQYHKLHSMHQTVSEARQLQACSDTLQDLTARRQALLNELERSHEAPIEVKRLREMEGEFDRLFHDLRRFERRVEDVHVNYPNLFSKDLEDLKNKALENDRQLKVLLKPHRPTPAQNIRDVLRKTTFADFLTPHNNHLLFFNGIGLIYQESKFPEKLPPEYALAFSISEQVRRYKRVEKLITDGDFLAINLEDLAILTELSEDEIQGLKTLFTDKGCAFLKTTLPEKTSAMQIRLVKHFRNMLCSCPALSSPTLMVELDTLDKQPFRPQEICHAKHEEDFRSHLTPQTQYYCRLRIAHLIENNRLEELTFNEIDRFKYAYNPNYEIFHELILKTLNTLRNKASPQDLGRFIGYVKQFVLFCPDLDQDYKIHNKIAQILLSSPQTEKVLSEKSFNISFREPPCKQCIRKKLINLQWEKLTSDEVELLRHPTKEKALFQKLLQCILDISTRAELLIWKEDHLDSFLEEHKYPSPLQDVEGIAPLIREMNYRLYPPTLWDWICVLLEDLLRILLDY